MKEYKELKDELIESCDLECKKCNRLNNTIDKLQIEVEELNNEINYLLCEDDSEAEINELIRLCNTKDEKIKKLNEKNDELKKVINILISLL